MQGPREKQIREYRSVHIQQASPAVYISTAVNLVVRMRLLWSLVACGYASMTAQIEQIFHRANN